MPSQRYSENLQGQLSGVSVGVIWGMAGSNPEDHQLVSKCAVYEDLSRYCPPEP